MKNSVSVLPNPKSQAVVRGERARWLRRLFHRSSHPKRILPLTPRFSGVVRRLYGLGTVSTVLRPARKLLKQLHTCGSSLTPLKRGVNEDHCSISIESHEPSGLCSAPQHTFMRRTSFWSLGFGSRLAGLGFGI